MAVCSQALAINPGLRDGIRRLLLGETEHLRNHSRAGNLHKYNMVQAYLVVGVQKGQATLNLVCPDHSLQDLFHSYDLSISKLPSRTVGAGDPIRNSQDGAQVVRRMAPFSGEPAVVVVEPSNHGPDVEGAIDRVKLERGAGNPGAIGNNGALDHRAQELRALLEPQALEPAAERVEEDESRGVELQRQ